MKKLMLLVFALSITTTSLFASIYPIYPILNKLDKVSLTNEDTPIVSSELIRNQIIELIESPQFHLTEDLNAVVTFTFSTAGHIVLLDIDNNHRDLLKHMREELNYKIFDLPGEFKQVYKMPLKVKVLHK